MTVHDTRTRPIEVHAWLDVACPGAGVAERRCEAVQTEYGSDLTVRYRSFELPPDLPVD
jgi:predicted DsbA family dithiol-disulfide isomerase